MIASTTESVGCSLKFKKGGEFLDSIKAVVQKIVLEGKHGPFAVATSDQIEGSSVTFSLEPTVWMEDEWPEEGMIVLLEDLRQKRAGWRAKKGRFFKPSDEQIENRKEHDMLIERMKVFIESLREKWFPIEDDKIWAEWVDYKQREVKDLIELLNSDVRDSFKRRAMFLLLVPTAELNPIYWTQEVGKFYHKTDFLKTLNPDVLSYATDLVVKFSNMLKSKRDEGVMHRSESYFFEGKLVISFHASVPGKYHDALYFYNDCIMVLLTLLPEKECERIFPLFSLRDISTFSNLEDCSGYGPFRKLLRSEVDERWKKKADLVMREIVKNELTGKTKPREDWEDALRQYADIINSMSYGGNLDYSIDLYVDQLKFLISEEHYGRNLIDNWTVSRVFQLLHGENYREIRYSVARFAIFGNEDEFRVWSNDTLKAAQIMLDEFGKSDNELAQKIQLAINESRKRSVFNRKREERKQKDEDVILNRMR